MDSVRFGKFIRESRKAKNLTQKQLLMLPEAIPVNAYFLILLLGSVSGSAAGTYLSGGIVEGIGDRSYYDRTFGNGAAADGENAPETGREMAKQGDAGSGVVTQNHPVRITAECALLIIGTGTVIASVGTYRNLCKEPMKMFVGR